MVKVESTLVRIMGMVGLTFDETKNLFHCNGNGQIMYNYIMNYLSFIVQTTKLL